MKNIFLLLIVVSFAGCKKDISVSGRLISSVDSIPLDNARVYWTSNDRKTTVSDSLGNFTISDRCTCMPYCPELEMVFLEKGYEMTYADFTDSSDLNLKNVVIKMAPATPTSRKFKETRTENLLKSLNGLISLLNIFTLTMIFLNKFKYKTIWILAIAFLSFTIKYNYLSERLEFYPISFFIQLRMSHFGWYLYYIPLPTIFFWIYYFYKKAKGNTILVNLE
jgi:hypothetical protein